MFKHEGNTVYLNGLKVPVTIFLQLEPSYSYPSDIVVMFYDGARRHYRTKHRSWTLWGRWEDGERYLSRADEFASIMAQETSEMADATAQVSQLKTPPVKDKYPVEGIKDVKLHKRDDLDKSGTEGVRSKGKRVSRSRGKHSGGAVGGSSE